MLTCPLSAYQPKMIVLLDTEFTSLKRGQLLSVGMVTLDGREFYAELDLSSETGKKRVKASNTFVHDTVLSQWGRVPGSACSEYELGRRAGEWLLALAVEEGAKVEVAFDYRTDFELLESAIRESGIWDQVKDVVLPVYIDPLTANIDGEIAQEDTFRETFARSGLEPHHALADAIALRSAYVAIKAVVLSNIRDARQA